MVSRFGSVSSVVETARDEVHVQQHAAERSRVPMRGIMFAVFLGLICWAVIIWAAIKIGGFLW